MRIRASFGAFSICLCQMAGAAVPPATMPALEVLSRSSVSLSATSVQQAETEAETTMSSSLWGNRQQRVLSRFLDDGKRLRLDFRSWHPRSTTEESTDKNAQVSEFLWDGSHWYEYYTFGSAPEARYIVTRKHALERKQADSARGGAALEARIDGDADPIPTTMGRNQAFIHPETQDVGGFACYVVESKGPDGAYTAWIDPAHGYLVAKADVEKGSGDLLFGSPLKDEKRDMHGHRYAFTHISFKIRISEFMKVGDVWLAKSATTESVGTLDQGGQNSQHEEDRRISISLLKPADSAFVPDFPNLTRVMDTDYSGPIHWRWNNGRVEPDVDEAVKEQVEKAVQDRD